VESDILYRIRAGRNVEFRNVKHFIKLISILLTKVLRNGFQSSFSISSAILNEGIVLPIYFTGTAIVIPILDNDDGKDTTVRGIINTSPVPSLFNDYLVRLSNNSAKVQTLSLYS